tara:strand:- start:214 stop:603 length:390 start_codon:yes stop_codon:yes gene_type:complete
MANNKRPLSPHIQIYKPQITSVLSISHRISGIFMSLGLLCSFTFLVLLSLGENYYKIWLLFSNSILGEILLLGWLVALIFHMLNGLRHLFWDIGIGLSLSVAKWTGIMVCIFTIFLTLIMGFYFLGLVI